MPPRVEFAPEARLERKGNTDWVMTTAGKKKVRVFDGASGHLGLAMFKLNPYQARHGGASRSALMKRRSMEAIKKRLQLLKSVKL